MIQIQTGFLTLLGLLFIALKLTGVITWSWWLVTLPLWFGWAIIAAWFLIAGGAVLVVLALAVIAEVIATVKGK